MNLPNFIRKEPTMTDKTSKDIVTLAATPTRSPIEAANALGASVAQLISERDQLRNDLDFVRRHNEELVAQLSIAQRDADHYRGKAEYFERFSMRVVSNFDVIRSIIDETQRRANEHAKDTPTQKQEAPPEQPQSREPTTDAPTSVEAAVEAALREAGK